MAVIDPVVLDQAKRKMLALRATGGSGWKITQFAVGDGNGASYTPDSSMTGLKNELIRKSVASYEKESDDAYIYHCLLAEDECVGASIREIALIDSDGMPLFIKVFSAKKKDSDREMEFKIRDTF